MQRLIIGTYPTGETPGSGEGLWDVHLDRRTGCLAGARLLVETPSPSFAALHPGGGTLFAVAELAQGRVTSFTLTVDALEERESRPTLGADPCHVVAGERSLWIANYTSGTFTSLGLDADAAFTGEFASFGHEGSGPDATRQNGPHAHFVLPAPDGDGAWVVDLGTDEIRRYNTGPQAVAAAGIAGWLPAGAGPRHAVVHPSGTVFVVGELDSQVYLLRANPGANPGADPVTWEVVDSVPACVSADPGTGSFPSHVALSADGTRLYVAVRGPDVLATFAILPDAAATQITHLADTPIGGAWPRHFAVLAGMPDDAGMRDDAGVPDDEGAHDDAGAPAPSGNPEVAGDLVVVANQGSSTLVVLRIDPVTGAGQVTDQADLPAPACVLPV